MVHSAKNYKLFWFFSPFHNARKSISPLHSRGSLLVSEGSAYTGFTACTIIPHRIRKRQGSVEERKRRSPKRSVSQAKRSLMIGT